MARERVAYLAAADAPEILGTVEAASARLHSEDSAKRRAAIFAGHAMAESQRVDLAPPTRSSKSRTCQRAEVAKKALSAIGTIYRGTDDVVAARSWLAQC